MRCRRLGSAMATLALAAGASACGTAHVPARSRPVRHIVDPGYVVSSEALAGHPTPTPPRPHGCPRHPNEQPIDSPRWLDQVEVTEYFPTPESWFVGRKVSAPGLVGRHRVDWLYSSSGIAMEGTGIALDGARYSLDRNGSGGWVNARGKLTLPSACASRWSDGQPAWFAGGWRNAQGAVTFPLERGGWSNGAGKDTRSYGGATFARQGPTALKPYRSVAVDPQLIPLGSKIYVPAYKPINGGWFVAADTGGGIIGRHLDVYRPPTAVKDDGGRYLTGERIYVIPPKAR